MKNIVLLCNLGMSTSLLVSKMREAAKENGYECTINAYPVAEAMHQDHHEVDMILLGPQVRHQLNAVKQKYPTIPVEAIDTVAYGMMDGKKIYLRVKEVLGDQ